MSGDAGAPDPKGDRTDLDGLFVATYQELRRLAGVVHHGDPSATLTPTALVNEAWLKLAGSPSLASLPPLHFKRVAARAMRQVLVEAARRRHAAKRGGKDGIFVTLDDSIADSGTSAGDILGLDQALEALATLSPRQATMVEARYFGGLDVTETAELLGISEATVLRDWRVAKAWLAKELRDQKER